MKRTALFRFLLVLPVLFGWAHPLQADSFLEIARTDRNTLNDLLEEVPLYSRNRELQIRRMSAVQEQLVVFEEEMRGEGLPEPLRSAFSIHYSAIMSALVDDQICEEEGRDALSIHRQLLYRTHLWMEKRIRDEKFPEEVIQNLHYFLTELEKKSTPRHLVSAEIRTPVINGYQFWVGELLAWGETCGHLNPGQLSRLAVSLGNLERIECLYKRDGILYRNERDDLHRRFIDLTRYTIDLVGRRH